MRVARADVLRWADHRIATGTDAKTVNGSDLAALSAIFAWGTERGWMATNPADGVRIKRARKPKVRERYFSADEAAAILNAASAVNSAGRERVKTTAAKRWVPWLCAYSGARVMEAIQLRRQDVRQKDGNWIMRLTPEAGSMKVDEYRDVPLHEHLIASGFLAFVKASSDGPLFCDIGRDGTIRGPAAGVYNRLRTFVREVVPDANVQPSHAWRYTFKTRGFEVGIEEHLLNAICGHAPRSIGAEYIRVTLQAKVTAMARFPRYAVPSSASAPTSSPDTSPTPPA